MKTFILKHRFLSYMLFTYLWSGTVFGSLFIVFPGGLAFAGGKPVNAPAVFYLFFILGGIGPGVAACMLTAVTEGRTGCARLFGRIAWKFNPALLIPAAGVPLCCAWASRRVMHSYAGLPVPEPSAVVIIPAVCVGLLAGLMEEFGWRGYAYDSLRGKKRMSHAAIMIGMLWAFWHLSAAFWGVGGLYGKWFPLFFLCATVIPLTAYSIIMTGLTEYARMSMLPTVICHASLSASAGFFLTNASDPTVTVIQYAVYSVFTSIAAVIFCVLSGHGMRRKRDFGVDK